MEFVGKRRMKEFKLSEKIEEADEDTIEEYELTKYEQKWLYVEDVKEFIRLLKANLNNEKIEIKYDTLNYLENLIDNLAGDLK